MISHLGVFMLGVCVGVMLMCLVQGGNRFR